METTIANKNFGLSGQPPEAYDNFLGICFTARCRRKKDARQKLRNEKKSTKIDSRKAETEALRAETEAVKAETKIRLAESQREAKLAKLQAKQAAAPAQPQVIYKDAPVAEASGGATANQANLGNKKILLIVGALALAGFLWSKFKGGKAVALQK